MFFEPVRFELLENQLRHYSWGCQSKHGHLPYLAELLSLPDDGRPLAELWIGAHPSLPSAVQVNSEKIFLDVLINKFPDKILGKHCRSAGFESLPFLLKILSCEHPLSIQCHPNKKNAAYLHREFPQLYPDQNHKPEILLALTPFAAMAGFRQLKEILVDLKRRGIFAEWINLWQSGAFSPDVRGLCHALFEIPEQSMQKMLRLAKEDLEKNQTQIPCELLFLHLMQEYPNDKGCLFAFLLNHLLLDPGQAIFIAPGQVHAYLKGTGIECMACSDNVIRAGLTEKQTDSQKLLQNADFSESAPQIQNGALLTKGKRIYPTPASEFRLTILEQAALDLEECSENPAVLLVLQGKGEIRSADGSCSLAEKGSAWLRPAKLRKGSFRPLTKETRAVWCESICCQ